MNYLLNKYNVSRRCFKTSLHYHVKHKGLKNVGTAVQILDDRSVPNFYDYFVHRSLQLKMSSFGLYAGTKMRSPSIVLSTHWVTLSFVKTKV